MATMMNEPSAQLNAELQQSVQQALARRRPLLHHLNADSSWLLQLPRPAISVKHSGRRWFNILIDPWLGGSQSDVAAWFSQQWHASAPAVGSIREVEQLAREVERLGAGHGLEQYLKGGLGRETSFESDPEQSPIDAIAVSHEFTDHCHRETLLQCHPDIPVFATAAAAVLVQSWRHFRSVLEIPAFPSASHDLDWRQSSLPPLPEWLGLCRLQSSSDALYYHSALMIVFDKDSTTEFIPPSRQHVALRHDSVFSIDAATDGMPAEAIIYTPHGISADDLRVVTQARPRIETLALLHGLHDIALVGQQLNKGAHSGLLAQRLLQPRYWIGTHDAQKIGGGIVSWFLRRKIVSLEEALKVEAARDVTEKGMGTEVLDKVDFIDLGNGESALLE